LNKNKKRANQKNEPENQNQGKHKKHNKKRKQHANNKNKKTTKTEAHQFFLVSFIFSGDYSCRVVFLVILFLIVFFLLKSTFSVLQGVLKIVRETDCQIHT
jgi:ABC-type nickel/cobalt efflux system permease component RcnA